MTRRALIGHTGFVGSVLKADGKFTHHYNSANIGEMEGEAFDEVICCGVSAVKWVANKEPEKDWAGIGGLLNVLERASIRRFVLISTIDVYPDPTLPLDEGADLTGLPNHPYGRHRLAIEEWVAGRFTDHLIIRLPALFGPGLKKNALFDLLHDHEVGKINPAAMYQWYPLARLADDITVAASADVCLVNLFTAPVITGDIVATYFPGAPVGPFTESAPVYQLRTRHAARFGGHDGFVMDARAVMDSVGVFVAEFRASVSVKQSSS
jgi:NAD dependent epimerase/dehydratase family